MRLFVLDVEEPGEDVASSRRVVGLSLGKGFYHSGKKLLLSKGEDLSPDRQSRLSSRQ